MDNEDGEDEKDDEETEAEAEAEVGFVIEDMTSEVLLASVAFTLPAL
jgi:hypothetical protein